MRKINLRVWDKTLSCWVIPYNCSHLDSFAFTYKNQNWYLFGDTPLDQKRYVIQQSTNFFDKNGIEIYEGDILAETENGFEEDKKTYAWVEYDSENAQFIIKNTEGSFNFYHFSPFRFEVVGNIYENPDLIQ